MFRFEEMMTVKVDSNTNYERANVCTRMMVAFSFRNIMAGEELTWDYQYQVGSVPNKELYCYCGTSECRGRLL